MIWQYGREARPILYNDYQDMCPFVHDTVDFLWAGWSLSKSKILYSPEIVLTIILERHKRRSGYNFDPWLWVL